MMKQGSKNQGDEGTELSTKTSECLAAEADRQSGLLPETGWLIEKTFAGDIHYITVDQVLTWTRDPLKALRLARKEDADMLCEIVEDAEKVAEHQWG